MKSINPLIVENGPVVVAQQRSLATIVPNSLGDLIARPPLGLERVGLETFSVDDSPVGRGSNPFIPL